MTVSLSEVDAVRRFNRFYTRQIGILDERFLSGSFSLTEARILYELATRHGLTASDLRRDLGLDAGYLSRVLKSFETSGLVARQPCGEDGRRAILALTERGRAAFEPLDKASQRDVAKLLERLSRHSRASLTQAMSTISSLLDDTLPGSETVVLRPLRVGDLGWITHRQALLYGEEYGWDATYEALVAEILAGFVRNFDPDWEASWVAERDGNIVGSVFLVRASEHVAKLRLLYVEPSVRGSGLGRRLVAECIGFAQSKNYRTLTLWTNDVLTAARRIYEAAGFVKVGEEPHRSFGKDLVGQTWELSL